MDVFGRKRECFELLEQVSGSSRFGFDFDAFDVEIIEPLIGDLLLLDGVGVEDFVILLKVVECIA